MGLRWFSQGPGVQQGEIMPEFPDDPDREERFREKYSGCVGFYYIFDEPSEQFVPMREFMGELDEMCRTYLEDKEEEYKGNTAQPAAKAFAHHPLADFPSSFPNFP
ncbi:MAG: hypothetical protein IK999_16995 [Ruminococcus sp.]|nr:hypothetical protein [Ruminococcus sp.]